MKAIFKKEWKSFLTSMTGYIFIAFLLVLSGVYLTAYSLQSGYPKVAYTLESIVFVFLIAVPILTMRMLAEERKQKTDQLLLTSPVSVTGIVLGKYLALVAVYGIAVVVMALYPLILSQFGSIPWGESYTALFGFFLMGCCYLAIGLYLSSVTESQVIAAVLTFLVLFCCFVIQGIASFFPETASASYFTFAVLAAGLSYVVYLMINQKIIAGIFFAVCEAGLLILYLVNASCYEGLIQDILGVLNISAHFSGFAEGIFDIQGLIYYVSFAGVFLFFTVQSIQKRRWGERRLKNGSYSISVIAIAVAAAVAVNLIAAELPSQYMQIDVSEQQLYTLTEQTKEIVAGLEKDITLYYIVQDSNKDTNVSRLLERYEGLSSHITVEQKDPVRYPNFASQYTDSEVSENSIIAVCEDSVRVITYDSMYESSFNYNYYTYETTGFDAEGQITSAIAAFASGDLPKLYTLTGHNELMINDSLAQSISKENIETESLNLITADEVPEDAACLLIASPSTDFSDEETAKILDYLQNGGKVILVTDYTGKEMPNLASILEYYGVEEQEGIVIEGDSNYYVQAPYYLVPDINSTEVTDGMTGGESYVLLAAAQGIHILEEARESLSISGILSTSDSAYSKTDVENMRTYEKESSDTDGPFDLAVLITEEVTAAGAEEESGDTEEESEDAEEESESAEEETVVTKLVVFTSSAIMDASADQMVSGGNAKLFMNTVSWACGHASSVSVPSKSMSVSYLTLTAASSSFWSIIVIGLIPAAFLITGLVTWLRRRRQ